MNFISIRDFKMRLTTSVIVIIATCLTATTALAFTDRDKCWRKAELDKSNRDYACSSEYNSGVCLKISDQTSSLDKKICDSMFGPDAATNPEGSGGTGELILGTDKQGEKVY